MLQFDVHFTKFPGALFEIWHPWHPFFGQNQLFFAEFLILAKIIRQNDNIYFLFCFVSLKWSKNPKSVSQPCKNSKKYFMRKILVIIILICGIILFLWYNNSKCPFSSFFPGVSKIATLIQYFNYKKALPGPKEGSVSHKKFQRSQNWGQILS